MLPITVIDPSMPGPTPEVGISSPTAAVPPSPVPPPIPDSIVGVGSSVGVAPGSSVGVAPGVTVSSGVVPLVGVAVLIRPRISGVSVAVGFEVGTVVEGQLPPVSHVHCVVFISQAFFEALVQVLMDPAVENLGQHMPSVFSLQVPPVDVVNSQT